MVSERLQQLCETGQRQLIDNDYTAAERTLAEAERLAWVQGDFDTLARLYMPLQEARRQRRQRCGEGIVRLDLLAENEFDHLDANHIIDNYPFGQFVVAGWGTAAPAIELRRLQREYGLYLETFLGATYPTHQGRAVILLPLEQSPVPPMRVRSLDELRRDAPPHSQVLHETELPRGMCQGNPQTFARVADLWHRLHQPFLAAAEAEADPLRKITAYRRAIEVDYACELAHQHLSDAAHALLRRR